MLHFPWSTFSEYSRTAISTVFHIRNDEGMGGRDNGGRMGGWEDGEKEDGRMGKVWTERASLYKINSGDGQQGSLHTVLQDVA